MKTLRISFLVIGIVLLIPLLGYSIWLLRKGTSLDVMVVNKSLTKYRSSENEAMNYVLSQNKILTNGNRPYNLRIDHFGLMNSDGDIQVKFPRLKDIDRTVEKADLVYYADAGGVMVSDIRELPENEPDKLEYGGLNNTDYVFLRGLIASKKPVMLEFAFLSSSTDPLVKYNIEQLLDIYYTGWIGKSVSNLGEEDNTGHLDWKDYYRKVNGEAYSGNGAGIVFLNPVLEHIIVLEEGRDYNASDGLIHSTEQGIKQFGIPESVNFSGWFSVLHPGNNAELSSFVIDASEGGKKMLNEEGLPSSFPAVIEFSENSYVFAGDFGRSKADDLFPRVEGLRQLFSATKRNSRKPSNFFYSYYKPYMNTIVKQIKIKHKEEGKVSE